MATYVKSAWKLTWDPTGTPLVLVDFDDRMIEEPTFPQTHEIQAQPFLRANFKTTWDRGNVHFETTFSKVSSFTTPQSLRNYALSQSVIIAALRHSTLKIEVENGDTYELRNASISASSPVLSSDIVKSGNLAFTYRAIGGQLIKP